jgi:hypothetical protein
MSLLDRISLALISLVGILIGVSLLGLLCLGIYLVV